MKALSVRVTDDDFTFLGKRSKETMQDVSAIVRQLIGNDV